MFHRDILDRLRAWSQLVDRKPLVLRGARQVGKTYSGVLCIQDCRTTAGKTFRLLNLPYFLVYRIHDYLDWMLGHPLEAGIKRQNH